VPSQQTALAATNSKVRTALGDSTPQSLSCTARLKAMSLIEPMQPYTKKGRETG